MAHTSHAILFVRPFDADTTAVSMVCGRWGFGHVALWAGDVVGDQPIVLDSSIGNGVGFRPLREMTRGVPYVSLWLDDALGARIFARALRCIGAPYHYRGLFSSEPSPGAYTCSGLVACALPHHLSDRCRRLAGTFPVSPNAIAKGLGVPKWSPTP